MTDPSQLSLVDRYRKAALIFVHIPKAAGTTLNRILEQQYKPTRIFAIKVLTFQQDLQRLKSLPESDRQKIKVLRGHFHHGMHTLLPTDSVYMTVVRDPVDRLISHYYYVSSLPNHYLHDQIKTQHMSLKDYACSNLTLEVDNHQTRMLAGGDEVQDPIGQASTQMLERAKQNLREQFAVVGIAERFDETLILLKELFDWSLPLYYKRNVTRGRPKKERISEADRHAIETRNALDMELYRYANALLDEQIQTYVRFFRIKLFLFRLLNRGYNIAHQMSQAWPKPAQKWVDSLGRRRIRLG